MINLSTFHESLAQPTARGYDLDEKQKEAVEYEGGPLWLLAGPGSGKSEVLVTRTLKLLCVDGVNPRSIMLTTFTNKAARNLEDRLAAYLAALQETSPSLQSVDLADIRIGTIHSLCNDILQEYRSPNYQNVRLLNDVEQHLFTYRNAEIAKHEDLAFWREFEHSVKDWGNKDYCPNKWKRVKASATLFNHIVEDRVDVQKMLLEGGHWATLAKYYQQYVQALKSNYRCDFAHLQSCFLEFINSPGGQRFLEGGTKDQVPLQHILVDEYQDTNPIQEGIYLALAHQTPHDTITVVGDDDQALYRFRGGNVSCMVNFDKACMISLGKSPHKIQLDKNYRSHSNIVNFFNSYITSFSEMKMPGVRAPGKNPVKASSSISGSYPAVSWIERKKVGDLPNAVADVVKNYLISDGILSDYSQCVLLVRSAKDSPNNAGPFIKAFEERGIPVYNPRSKSFMESEEVQCLIAALIEVIDQDHTFSTDYKNPTGKPYEWVLTVQKWMNTLKTVRCSPEFSTNELDEYLKNSNVSLLKLCQHHKGGFLNRNLLEILHRILALEPFHTWQKDSVKNQRFSKVTRLFDGYHSFKLDGLRSNELGKLDPYFLHQFYQMFISYLIDAGIDDDEDEEVIVPQGSLPIMTIHQAKGLEFPFVFVAQLGQKQRIGAAQILERDLAKFRQDLYPRSIRSPEELAVEDDIRLLYVAYSRAQYSLTLVGTKNHIKNHVAAPGRNYSDFQRSTKVI
ncbi:ATP-dependent helicase [Oscillatoria sp. HE19RPO]|uniref:ATP-dependent helicase n=1 Tax=Oscillatoria sp. HE19RPO TaxID=2954806 RepID=UPI0020C526DD|nr:ATP-dependent helicase [Oscillatoria sp. HE19RPO]